MIIKENVLHLLLLRAEYIYYKVLDKNTYVVKPKTFVLHFIKNNSMYILKKSKGMQELVERVMCIWITL